MKDKLIIIIVITAVVLSLAVGKPKMDDDNPYGKHVSNPVSCSILYR